MPTDILVLNNSLLIFNNILIFSLKMIHSLAKNVIETK